MDPVEDHQRGGVQAGATQKPGVVTTVTVGSGELRFVHTTEAGFEQSQAEVLVGMVEQRERVRAHSHSEAVRSANRDISAPQTIENGKRTSLDGPAVRFVLLRVQACPDVLGGLVGRALDWHGADHHNPLAPSVMTGVIGNEFRTGDDVVVNQQHDLRAGPLDTYLQGTVMSAVFDGDEDQTGVGPGSLGAPLVCVVIGTVEDHH